MWDIIVGTFYCSLSMKWAMNIIFMRE